MDQRPEICRCVPSYDSIRQMLTTRVSQSDTGRTRRIRRRRELAMRVAVIMVGDDTA